MPPIFQCNSRSGFPFGSAEIFSLMQHMGCEPDRASYNIMVDAFGRAGLHEGKSNFRTFFHASLFSLNIYVVIGLGCMCKDSLGYTGYHYTCTKTKANA